MDEWCLFKLKVFNVIRLVSTIDKVFLSYLFWNAFPVSEPSDRDKNEDSQG